jgi:transcription elongation GreA/GreB family factor
MVDIGSKVTVIFSGKKHTYTIVGEWEADPKEMKISHKSPLGKALFGKKVGDEVEFVAPAGKIIYKIHKID